MERREQRGEDRVVQRRCELRSECSQAARLVGNAWRNVQPAVAEGRKRSQH